MSSEFCPRCNSPLEAAADDGRLCEVCGWFGDQTEVLDKPPQPDTFNPVLATVQCLALYRDVCRNELIAEQVYDAGDATEADMRTVRLTRRQATDSLVSLFIQLRKQRLPRVNGRVLWPEDWLDRHYNASNEPCDMLVGPCSCGAWHMESDDWVQAALKKHNAEILP
ncbi:MAG: hypothetical protein ACYDH4_12820 [Candidatus Cryosericum sp.]